MEKNDLLRFRVPTSLREDFEATCKIAGKTSAEVLREITEQYVRTNSHLLTDRVVVHISRPEGYDFGAWRIYAHVRNAADATWNGKPVPFFLPQMEKRRFVSDSEYASVVAVRNNENSVQYELGGIFISGEWRGHVYSNGIPENENPTSIEALRSRLVETFTAHLDALG